MDSRPPQSRLVTYGLYPLVVGGATSAAVLFSRGDADPTSRLPIILMSVIGICMLVEWRRPLERRWAMSTATLVRRDLPFVISGLIVERISELAVAAIARHTVSSGGFGPAAQLPIGLQVVLAVVAFDLAWYWYHRITHRHDRLWRVHGAHHTPRQLYVVMHAVFHPFDELVVRFVLALLVFRFGGFTPDATFISLALIGSIGIISHANIDVRLWAFNHLFIGPETHRHHHSVEMPGNYGTVTSIWDQIFGTFFFSFDPPAALGLADGSPHPAPERFLDVVAWPFRASRKVGPAETRSPA